MRIEKIWDVKTPTRGTSKSSGIDFYVPNIIDVEKMKQLSDTNEFIFRDDRLHNDYIEIKPHERVVIASGIKVEVPENYALIGFNKSGVAVKKGLDLGACVIDEDYTGEVFINLINTSNDMVRINVGEKIAQFLLINVFYDDIIEVDKIERITERNDGSMGSTGIN